MKRFLSLLLITAVMLLSVPFAVYANDSAYSGTLGDSDTSYSFDNTTGVLTIYGAGATADYGYTNSPWYNYLNAVKSIEIKEGVTVIGTNLFRHLSEVTFVSLPSSVTDILDHSFYDMSSLTTIRFGANVKSIGDYAFATCTDLRSIYFDDMTSSLTLGVGVFVRCTNMKSTAFPVNTVFGQYSIGFIDEDGILQSDFTLQGIGGTSAYYYANGCGVAFDDSMPLYYNSVFGKTFAQYTEENWYQFTPNYDGEYHFYSCGSVDTLVTAYDSAKANVIAQNDDKSNSNLNFDLTVTLSKGSTYYFKVTNVHSLGDYTCYIYPSSVKSITASLPTDFTLFEDKDSEYAFDSNGDTYSYYDMTDYYSQIAITVTYNSGYVDTFNYTDKKYNDIEFSVSDTQDSNHWLNGTNYMILKYGDFSCNIAVNVHVHSYVMSKIEPTCTESGAEIYTCSCGDSYQVQISPLGHQSEIAYLSQTCTESGYYYEYCTRCGVHLTDTQVFLPNGHLYKIISSVPPTEISSGVTTYKCTNCSDTYSVYTELAGYVVTGNVVVMESPDGSHKNNLKYPCDAIYEGSKNALIDSNGYFRLHLESGEHTLTFSNSTGPDRTVNVTVDGSDIDLGTIALVPYDFNDDGIITPRDFAIFHRFVGEKVGDDGYSDIYDFNGNGQYDDDDMSAMINYYTYGKIDSSIYDFDR